MLLIPYVFRDRYLHLITGNTNRNPKASSSQFQSSKVGCPIRKSTDQRLFAPTRSLSQRTTSFIASYRQGIHQMPFGHLIALISNAHRVRSCQSLRRRDAALAGELRLGAHCTERPEVIRINPIQILACARSRRSSTSTACAANALGRRRRLRRRSGISPLYDVNCARSSWPRAAATEARGGKDCSFAWMELVEPDGIEPTTSSLQS